MQRWLYPRGVEARPFDHQSLKTLDDARACILALSEREQAQPHWQAAAAVLLQVATHGWPFLMIARIAVSRALHGIVGVEPTPAPRVTKQERWKGKGCP